MVERKAQKISETKGLRLGFKEIVVVEESHCRGADGEI